MFGLLMVNQDFEVIKVAFAVVAPRSRQHLLDVGMMTLLLGHLERRGGLFKIAMGGERVKIWRRKDSEAGCGRSSERARDRKIGGDKIDDGGDCPTPVCG